MTHGDAVNSASFSPDGKRVVTASRDKTARVWDAETGKPVGEAMTHGDAVNSASFSPDGKRVVTASEDKTARVWDAETGKPVGEAMTHTGSSVNSASFSPDGKRVVTASGGQDGPRLGRRDRQARGRGDDARRHGQLRQLQPRRQARGHGVTGQDGPRLGCVLAFGLARERLG